LKGEPFDSSPELREIAKFVEYVEKVVNESEIGLSPRSIELIKRKYLDLKMKAEIDIRTVPKFMENVAFSKMKELDLLELRLETALQVASDKYNLLEMQAECKALKNSVEAYKALAFAFASILAIIIGVIISQLI